MKKVLASQVNHDYYEVKKGFLLGGEKGKDKYGVHS